MSDSVGTTERKKYLDAAKGWGILMVVFGHITKLGNPIDIWFGAYKLAVFYFVSGYLLAMRQSFRKMSTGEYIKKHAKSLLIPYFGYSAFVMLYNVIVGIMKWKSTTDIFKRFLLQAYMTFSFRGISALWFLPTLFFALPLFKRQIVKHPYKLYGCFVDSHFPSDYNKKQKRNQSSGCSRYSSFFMVCVCLLFPYAEADV